MTNPLYGNATAVYLVLMGSFLLCSKFAERHPATSIYRTVPQSLAWATGAGALYSLLQMVLPILDTPSFDALGVMITYGSGALVVIFFLKRARYVEDTAALVLLLFALVVLLLFNLARFPHPASPRSLLAFYAAWCVIGSAALFPCRWFDRRLGSRLEPILPPPVFLRPPQVRGRTPARRLSNAMMISTAGAITATLLTGGLFFHHRLDSFVAALPWTAGLMLGVYLLGTAIHWGLRWLFQSRPLYSQRHSERASSVTVTTEPCDDQQKNRQIYQGPTAPDGSIPGEVQTRMDEVLQSGEAASIPYRFDTEVQGSQYLPSYCTGGWPNCRTCSCRQAVSQQPPTVQEG